LQFRHQFSDDEPVVVADVVDEVHPAVRNLYPFRLWLLS
jgi:hypothetical protein